MLVLLDRDGVINEDLPGSVLHRSQFKPLLGAFAAIAQLTRAGFTCAVITNQSAVGSNRMPESELHFIHEQMREMARAAGGNIADIFYCTDTPDAPTYRRKPAPGMLLEALAKYNADAAKTPFIGDALRDMQAAYAAGCPRFLVRTGKGERTLAEGLPSALSPVTICTDLKEAAEMIVKTYT